MISPIDVMKQLKKKHDFHEAGVRISILDHSKPFSKGNIYFLTPPLEIVKPMLKTPILSHSKILSQNVVISFREVSGLITRCCAADDENTYFRSLIL